MLNVTDRLNDENVSGKILRMCLDIGAFLLRFTVI
jgi:hypothetical protein